MNDFWEDITIDFIKDFFNRSGIAYTEYDRVGTWLMKYFNFKLRFITPKPWQIRVSKELSNKLPTHSVSDFCFDIFIKASKGENLNPYQSKGLRSADVNDDLFNDWGLHHLHLNSNRKKHTDFFTERSDDLLIVRFEGNIAYMIDIVRHKQQNLWSSTDFIRIIQSNWPKLLAHYEIGTTITPNFDDAQIGMLRKKGYSFGINVGDKSYFTLNHGYMCSGDNALAVELGDNVIRWGFPNRILANTNRNKFVEELKRELGLQ